MRNEGIVAIKKKIAITRLFFCFFVEARNKSRLKCSRARIVYDSTRLVCFSNVEFEANDFQPSPSCS